MKRIRQSKEKNQNKQKTENKINQLIHSFGWEANSLTSKEKEQNSKTFKEIFRKTQLYIINVKYV